MRLKRYLILKCFFEENKPRELIRIVVGKRRANEIIKALAFLSEKEPYFYIIKETI